MKNMTYIQLLKYNACILAFLISTVSSIAQINESDTVKFQMRVSTGGSFQRGNVELLTIKSRVEFTYSPLNNFIIKSQNSSLYQTFYNTKADNDIFSRNYIYYKPQRKFYPFGIAYISSNFRRKIDIRLFAGAGITWQLFNSSLHVIKISASTVYETTRFNSPTYNFNKYNGNDQIKVWRGTLYVGGWNYLLEKKVRLFYDAYWQPAFNNNNNYRTQLDIGIDFPIWKGLTFNVAYSFTHENVTILNIKQDDKILVFGLSYQLRKTKH